MEKLYSQKVNYKSGLYTRNLTMIFDIVVKHTYVGVFQN